MKILLVSLFILFNLSVKSQNRFTEIVHDSEYLSSKNDLDSLRKFNFKPLLSGLEVSYVFGVIGDRYKRIRVKILSIHKDVENDFLYHIKGKSKVGSTIEGFEGTLTLTNIHQLKPSSLDGEFDISTIYEGVLSGVYEFYEPKNKMHSGIFKGKYQGKFRISVEDEIFYNNLDLFKDGYLNNTFMGTWTDYITKQEKICKWADFRVPNISSDFDLGAGEFYPNEEYNDQGWKTYHDAFFNNVKKALDVEEGNWWE